MMQVRNLKTKDQELDQVREEAWEIGKVLV